MSGASTLRWIRPTRLTLAAVTATLAVVALTVAFLVSRYAALPDILPVQFAPNGAVNGWQYKTAPRVMMPALVQVALALVFGSIGTLLLSRSHGTHDDQALDVKAASVAAEYVALMTLIWVAFQGYAAVALVAMWQRQLGGLGRRYTYVELAGVALTLWVALRARNRFGRPEPRTFVPDHWVLRQLYRNAADPALFVGTRDGAHWTLNFGRPVAVALMAVVLGVGILGPAVILALLLR